MVKKLLLFDKKEDRDEVINSLKNTPNKIIHDSGGRIMVIETREPDEEILRKVTRKVRLSSDQIPERILTDPNSTESLFIRSFNLRKSPQYQSKMASRLPPGEEPEEKELFEGSCTEDV